MMGDIITMIFGNFIKGSQTTRVRQDFRALATKAILPLLSVVALGGCAIHPVQQDVTGLKTVEVVDRIRCETRRAIEDKAIDLLFHMSEDPNHPSKRLAELFQANRGAFANFPRSSLPTKTAREFYDRYINTAIAFEFSFDITENNGVGFIADPVRLISGGSAGVVVGASDANARNNIRRFTIAETFAELLSNRKLQCFDGYHADNFVYPIAGNIGIKELISTFIDLNQDKDLSPAAAGSATVFGDTLKFTTTLSASATPHVVIAPVGNRWGVDAPTNIGLSAGRTDIHQLTIGLAIGTPPPHGQPSLARRGGLGGLLPPSATGDATNKSRAVDAIADQHLKNFYDRGVFLSR
jgi:hypothetical protein